MQPIDLAILSVTLFAPLQESLDTATRKFLSKLLRTFFQFQVNFLNCFSPAVLLCSLRIQASENHSIPVFQHPSAISLPVSWKPIVKRSLEKIHSPIHRTRGVGQKHLLLTLRASSVAVCICVVAGLWMHVSLWQLAISCKSSTTL